MLLPLPDRTPPRVWHLYEKGVAGFYKFHLGRNDWHVNAGQKIKWQVDAKTTLIDEILPSMVMDIVLENSNPDQRIVIDTKFTSILEKGWHRDKTLHSGHIFQLYSYLRSQERDDDPRSQNADGILLYPSINLMADETVIIQGHMIRFATIDLTESALEIRAQLMRMIETPVGLA
jgi:5-methylcytosine-specific restriction enzyme subunit McrC